MKPHCCTAERTRLGRRFRSLLALLLPGTALVLIPKCPLCIVAYAALISGVGLSVSTAANLRIAMIAICAAAMIYLTANSLLSFRRNHRAI